MGNPAADGASEATALQYVPLGKDAKLWVEIDVDGKRAAVLQRDELEKELLQIKGRLEELPLAPDDKTLLEWARRNYPQMDYGAERADLETRLARITAQLDAMKA